MLRRFKLMMTICASLFTLIAGAGVARADGTVDGYVCSFFQSWSADLGTPKLGKGGIFIQVSPGPKCLGNTQTVYFLPPGVNNCASSAADPVELQSVLSAMTTAVAHQLRVGFNVNTDPDGSLCGVGFVLASAR
jgi:hypothetical protein